MKYILTVFISIISYFSFGQSPQEKLTEYSEKFPNEQAVFTINNETVEINIKKEDLHIVSEHEQELFLMTENASQFNEEEVDYSDFFEIDNIKAYTLRPHKNGYKKEKVSKIIDSDKIRNSYVFHDDIRSKSFLYDGVQKGAFTHFEYEESFLDPHFFGSFSFQNFIPVESSTYTIYVPEGVEIGYQLFGPDSLQNAISFSKTAYNKGTKYEWSVTNMPKMRPEGNAPSHQYFSTHVQVWIQKYTTSSGEIIDIYKDASKLHSWYAYLLQHVPQHKSEEFVALCDSIAKNAPTDIEKVKHVFYWVQENMNYIAFEAGLEGFIPRGADMIFKKRYGDCKDMANLIVSMLEEMGVTAHHTWIGSRDIPYTYNEVPTVSSDNHMIAAYITENDSVIFLDATSKHLPFGLPSSFIQGKQAMIHMDTTFILRTVPIISAQQNAYIDTTYMHITNKSIQGVSTIELTGYLKQTINRRLDNEKDKEITEFLKKYTKKGNNTYNVTDFTLINQSRKDSTLIIHTDFTIDNYMVSNKNELYINLNLDLLSKKYDIRKDRVYPIEYDNTETYNITNILKIPEGYSVTYIPENTEFSSETLSYSISYHHNKHSVTCTLILKNNSIFAEQTDFETIRALTSQLQSAYRESIILTKK
ncbi:MAG: DUF3857 and transglutaminase domain-containing protein [Bacteroidales bacterium]|jgi:hypothetical protein|nr:DUF3857 and transglutaminase domain-containing protein [Bacteroidales bacterium]